MNARKLVEILRTHPRQGAGADEPEGARWIQISDTLALEIADYLEKKLLRKGKR